jgi:hypothetical protein
MFRAIGQPSERGCKIAAHGKAGETVKKRIALWALIGAVVACFWVIFMMLTPPWFNVGRSLAVAISIPVSLIGRATHQPQTYYSVILLNPATYALVGLAVEPFYRRHR